MIEYMDLEKMNRSDHLNLWMNRNKSCERDGRVTNRLTVTGAAKAFLLPEDQIRAAFDYLRADQERVVLLLSYPTREEYLAKDPVGSVWYSPEDEARCDGSSCIVRGRRLRDRFGNCTFAAEESEYPWPERLQWHGSFDMKSLLQNHLANACILSPWEISKYE